MNDSNPIPDIQFCSAQTVPTALQKHFYKQFKLSRPSDQEQSFFVLYRQMPIATARFVPLNQAWWLRGLFVHPSYRRQGLAARLVEHALQTLKPCLAFALPELDDFYLSLKFKLIRTEELKADASERYLRYARTKPQLKIWQKP